MLASNRGSVSIAVAAYENCICGWNRGEQRGQTFIEQARDLDSECSEVADQWACLRRKVAPHRRDTFTILDDRNSARHREAYDGRAFRKYLAQQRFPRN